MKTSIGELTTDIDANTKNITSVTSRTSTLETNLSSISATLSSTKSTVDAHTTQISTANTNITTALNNASNAVSTANAANTTANSAKTTATTASTNASNAVTTANSASSNASTALTNSNTAISTANTASTNASNAVSTANKASTDVATLTTTVTNTVSRVSSLELTTSGLTTRVGNTETAISSLSIGGRNLIRNSIVDKDISYWSMSFGTRDTNIKFNNHNSVKIRTTGSGYDGIKSNGYTIPFKANTTYTFTIWAYRDSSSSDGNLTKILRVYMPEYKISTLVDYRNYINITSSNLPDKTWTKFTESFTTKSDSTSFSALQIDYNNVAGTSCVWVSDIKIEEGNQATDWTPAPEDIDSSIQSVKDYATQTINSNVSTINQTTDSIKANVSSLQSSVSTINTTLGNKADSSTVTSVTNRVSSLETGVSGINASITTLNSNVSSVTTTANAAKSAIDNLSIGGRNLITNTIPTSTSTWNNGYASTATANIINENTALSGKAAQVTINTITNSAGGFYKTAPALTSGKTYTWSVYLKASRNLTLTTVGHEQAGRIACNITTSWQKFSYTFTTDSNTYHQFVFYNGFQAGDILYVHSLKLEEGNRATTWTPAPEDIDSQITTVNSSVSSLQSSVSVLQNQIALKVEQSNIDSAVTTINGKIASTNATISSMQSSINLQLNSITSSVSQTVSTKNLINNPAFNNPLGSYNSVNNTPTNCSIANTAAITGWGFAAPPVCDNALHIRFDATGDNYIEFSNLFAKLKPSTTYTLSYYYTMNGNSGETCEYTGPSSFIYERTASQWNQITFTTPTGIGPDSVPNRSTWKRYSRTFTTQSTTDSIMLRFGFHQTHSSSWCEMLITGIQLELGSTATNWVNSTTSAVGTSITQSPVDVMTAFNNISSYFKVNKDGATFGDTSTGDYTVLGANGLQHHVGGSNYNYKYITYTGQITVDVPEGTSAKELTVAYPSDLVAMLNGTVPKGIVSVAFQAFANSGLIHSVGAQITNITSTSVTIKTVNYNGGGVIVSYILIA
nr:carbohydrate binding domain-containing protein [Clostridium beijerinckii]